MSNNGLLTLFQLEKEMRQAETIQALSFIIVNRLRTLIDFDQAVLFMHDHGDAKHGTKVGMVSDVADVEHNSPFVRWLIHLAQYEVAQQRHKKIHLLDKDPLPNSNQDDWVQWGHTHMLWLPLIKGDDQQVATLLLGRTKSFHDEELALLDKVTDVASHALWALGRTARKKISITHHKKWLLAGAVLLVLLAFVPVRQTVLAPAQVVAQEPIVVAAPMNGVISKISVEPNSQVLPGDVLLRYEDTELQGRLLIAKEQVLLAQTELLSAKQASFSDVRVKATVAVLESRFQLRQAEYDYVKRQVEKIAVTAPVKGVVIFNDKTDLAGLPVKTGQRLMQVADPYQTKLQIDLPVADGLSFSPGAKVRLFLDKSPLDSVEAELTYSSFEPYLTPAGVLSYRLTAQFTADILPRLGLQGTAKLSGEHVSLFYYVFRRPLTALRQMIGF